MERSCAPRALTHSHSRVSTFAVTPAVSVAISSVKLRATARVTGFDIPYPPPMLERHHLPGVDRILDAVARLQWEAES